MKDSVLLLSGIGIEDKEKTNYKSWSFNFKYISIIDDFAYIKYPTNWNLTVLQQLYLIGNHSHGFGVGINFNGIECLIHRYSCYASLNYIFRANTSFYIH